MMRLRKEAKSSEFGVLGSASRTPNSALRTDKRAARGAVQIEFALTIIIIIFVMFWIWELIMVTYVMNVISDAAKEGVRTGIVAGQTTCGGAPSATQDQTAVSAKVTSCVQWFASNFALHNVSGMTVAVTFPDSPATGPIKDGDRIRVVVQYPFVPFIRLPLAPTLNAAAEGRVVYNYQ